MPHREITKSAVPDQQFLLQQTFGNASVDDILKGIQPWIGHIETVFIHDNRGNRISFYKNTKTKSLICFIIMGFIKFADIILLYDYS
jgi:hypothetical protein